MLEEEPTKDNTDLKEIANKKPSSTGESKENSSKRKIDRAKIMKPILKITNGLNRLINRVIPPFEPRIDIDSKLIDDEKAIENTLIRYYSEIQILIGLVLVVFGFILPGIVGSGYLYFLLVAGVVLILTGFEIEEIYITSYRLLVRRIGFTERILRIPSDEEHLLEHVVSYRIGRAPANVILVVFALIGYLSMFANIAELAKLLVFIPATVILAFGLRLNRRAFTIYFAGGIHVILGTRKGVPTKIIQALQQSLYLSKDPPENEKIMKNLDNNP